MSFTSRIIGKLDKLPPARTHDIELIEDIEIKMPDGISLLADRYIPRQIQNPPLLLCRTPYGRKGLYGVLFAELFAERGYQVLIQSCRGTMGSGGIFRPNSQEHADGLATIKWMKEQDWYPGKFGTVGASYIGYTQWAIGDKAGSDLASMVLLITASTFTNNFYMGNSFSLEGHLTWCNMMKDAESKIRHFPLPFKVNRIIHDLPLINLDEKLAGKRLPAWRDVIENSEPPYKWWASTDRRDKVSNVKTKANFVSGWWDIFLPWMLEDYLNLKKRGHKPYLTIGPWQHASPSGMAKGLRQSITWHDAYLRNDKKSLRKNPVRIFVMGTGIWKEFSAWPPKKSKPEPWYIHADGSLSTDMPINSDPDIYVYNPIAPTPNSKGGVGLTGAWGQKDMKKIEDRNDVLVYTSKALEKDCEIIGPVEVELYVKSSIKNTDFLARLCDVYPQGRSLNVCDGLQRLRPKDMKQAKDGYVRVRIRLWPTAYCFRKGHRLRVHIASGAHPRWARNTGSGEPIATAEKLIAAHQEIYHDPKHRSAIILPVMK
jgi:putative CocE/NonD family hydrolase